MTHEDNVRNSSAFLLVAEYATAIAIASPYKPTTTVYTHVPGLSVATR